MRVERADLEALAMREETVPLRAVGWKRRPVVDALPKALHVDDMLTDRGRRARHFLQIMSGREVVSVRMGVEDPCDRQVILGDVGKDCIRIDGPGRPRFFVEVEHGIDDGAGPGGRIADDVLEAPGAGAEASFDAGRDYGD